jgi:hypothetical protein
MESQIEHFLPKGQTEVEDSIFICDDTLQCETCSSFLYTLSVAQIKAFVEDDDFTFDCSAVRVVIPANKQNAEFFTVDGIQRLFKEISELKLEEEIDYIEWDKTRSILTVTPIFFDSETGEVGLCLDILLKPFLDIFQVYFLEVRLEQLQSRYPELQFIFRELIVEDALNDELLDKQIEASEMPAFLRIMDKFMTELEFEDLKFILCWGVFNVDRKDNGEWYVSMLDFNQKSKLENKPGPNAQIPLGF